MKLPRVLAVIILFIALGFAKLNAQTVYVTQSGKKYHAKNCGALKDCKSKSLTLKEAEKQGYAPCAGCITEVKQQESEETGQKKSAKKED